MHVVFDNESLLSVGGFPTATSTGSDLEGVARASGIARTKTVHTIEEFKNVFDDALKTNDLTSIVAKVEAVGPKGYVTELALLENRFQFKRHIEKLTTNGTAETRSAEKKLMLVAIAALILQSAKCEFRD